MTTSRTSAANHVQEWLVAYVARELDVPPEGISVDEEFVNLGLSSRQAISLTGDLEAHLGRTMDPALMWEFPTIRRLAEHLGGRPSVQS